MRTKIRKELKKYIENNIFPLYNLNEKGHDINHINYVINRSMEFASKLENIDYEIVYVIAAYHDLGHHIDAKNHNIVSAKLLVQDEKIKEFFNDYDINIIKEAIEDHRASASYEPRSIYGKIVSSADRNTDMISSLKRSFSYTSTHNPNLSLDEKIEDCRKHLWEKFGPNGYARNKMFFEDKEYNIYLEEVTKLSSNPLEFKKICKEVNNLH